MPVRMKMLAAALVFAPAISQAAPMTLFFDDFAAEVANAPGTVASVNFSPLSMFDITEGAVDLFTNGGFGLPCGSEGCLDLDGTRLDAARLESKDMMSIVSGKSYELSLSLSGKNGGGDETVTWGLLGGPETSFNSPAGGQAATVEKLEFVAGSTFDAKIFIDHSGGDNFGLLLDAVELTVDMDLPNQVPVPASLPLLMGAGGLLMALRRRRR